jgi:hypothetical protein
MARRRIGDGSPPHLLGGLLTLIAAQAEREDVLNARSTLTAMEIASQEQKKAAEVRTAAIELAHAGLLRVGRAPMGHARPGGRYAQAFTLASASEERGPARRPRLRPVVLLITADERKARELGRVLREEGVLPVAVASVEVALALLRRVGFELVIAADPDAMLPRLQTAARLAGCGPVVTLRAADGEALMPLQPASGMADEVVVHPSALRQAVATLVRSNPSPFLPHA